MILQIENQIGEAMIDGLVKMIVEDLQVDIMQAVGEVGDLIVDHQKLKVVELLKGEEYLYV